MWNILQYAKTNFESDIQQFRTVHLWFLVDILEYLVDILEYQV